MKNLNKDSTAEMRYNDIENKLQNSGLRVTEQRRFIYREFLLSSEPLSAGEVHKMLQKRGVKVRLSTIYRNLDKFLKKGLIRRLKYDSEEVHYEILENEHHHHLICVECEDIVPLDCPLSGYEKKLRKETNYKIVEHEIKVYGFCPDCRILINEKGEN